MQLNCILNSKILETIIRIIKSFCIKKMIGKWDGISGKYQHFLSSAFRNHNVDAKFSTEFQHFL